MKGGWAHDNILEMMMKNIYLFENIVQRNVCIRRVLV